MPRRCSICTHPKVKKINEDICNNVSYRNIALRAQTSATSVMRHIETCLKLEVAAIRKEQKIEHAFDFEVELQKLFQRAAKVSLAYEEWHLDPDDSTKICVEPRDNELVVVYKDFNDFDKQGEPKVKKGLLRDLMRELNANLNKEPIAVMSKAMDNRKLYLDTFKTLTDRMEQIAKYYGHWTREKANPADNASIAKKVVQELITEGKSKDEAVEYVVGRYGVLEADLVG